MAIIKKTIYVCDFCKTEYKSQKSMNACIKKCKEQNLIEKNKYNKKNELQNSFVNNISSIDDVKLHIINIFKELGLEITFKTFNISYSRCISNTHDCPKGGKLNWNKDPTLPKGYPGFGGHMDFSVTGELKPEYFIEKNKYWYVSDLLRYYCNYLHMGSGGGDYKSYSCSFIMFFDDFPKLKKLYEKYELIIPKQNQYVINCEKNKELYNKDLYTFISNDLEYIKIQDNIRELEKQISNCYAKSKNISDELCKKFKSENILKYEIPKIEEFNDFKDICEKIGDPHGFVSYEPAFGS